MSYDLNVYLSRQEMPTPIDWGEAIVKAGFPVELDSDFDVEAFKGFLPAPVRGEMAGFEYYAGPVTADLAKKMKLNENINFTVMFAIGSRPLELVSALSAASVLTLLSGGVLVDPQEGKSYLGVDAIEWAHAQIART
ncbi:hypothetical protein [Sapientia aquatica]|jgi:hypothetical protein|uniref:Uncharacterized protein n=1 Tax=Sapientia aquatica TaxID=1549640 RepID=A0A4R5W410_9BURK|nr:hypothetical protein [Sapientia aquatica]TDK66388.1 hypothetical protein E2I14_07900 [Sapientia aquatica]